MPSNSEYAQRQFRTEAANLAEKELMEQEFRALRSRVQALEDKIAVLSNELALRKPVQENPRGFS